MTRTLANLRANPQRSRPERSHSICSVPHVVAEVQALVEELQSIEREPQAAPADADDRDGRPKRQGEGADPREAEILVRLAELNEVMAENSDEFRLRATWSDGEWRRWVDGHPPREEGKPGHDRDSRIGQGTLFCNTDALIDTLGAFVVSWNGDTLSDGDWRDLFAENVPLPEKAAMATAVLSMYENRMDFTAWRSALSLNLKRLSASVSPALSESAPGDSTGGSPPSSTSTSTPPATPPE